ncbi:hypothetical protein WR25_08131 [Diploscapter pachys]|uniref:Serpentine receptor class gamma n=1 Tax=Diploscapter pachys TaxID=2018661 RepID=A0A2A2JKW4_9BILA|nr:hypothetical protein WR25_08131 [Diploscapter pachys]
MESVIRLGGIQNNPLYNCSAHTPEEWAEMNGEKHPISGAFTMAYGIIIVVIYTMCLIVIASKELIHLSCYKIMFLLGVIDLCAICAWCTSCMLCLILVINRILDILHPSLGKMYFKGYRTNIVLIFPILYGSYFFFFTPAIVVSSRYQAWFFDPFIFNNSDPMVYANVPNTINNFSIVFLTCFLYGFFCIALYQKARKASSAAGFRSHKSSTLMCMINAVASVIYMIMQFIPVPEWLIIVAEMTWQIFWISSNIMSTDEQKLHDIKELMLPIIKRKYGHLVNGMPDDQLWKMHEPAFIQQFDYNTRWSLRLLKPDVPKEVRYLEHEIRKLKVKSDLYGRSNKNRVVNILKEAMNKYSAAIITKYTQLRNETLRRETTERPKSTESIVMENSEEHNETPPSSNKQLIYRDKLLEHWAKKFYDENAESTPTEIDYSNRQYYFLYVEEKSDAEKLEELKKIFFEETRANSQELYLSNEDLEAKWKNVVEAKRGNIEYVNKRLKRFRKTGLPERVRQLHKNFMKVRFSRQFYEHNIDDAIKMIKNTAKPYSDQELMWLDTALENITYTDNETPYGKRMLIIQENTRFYHDRYATWTLMFSNLINKRRKLECNQSKTVEQRMIELKPLNIEANEAWNKQKKTPEEAEKYWERERQNQKEQVEICDKQAKKFKGTGPRVNQLYWDIENVRLSDAFLHATYDKKLSMYTKVAAKYTDEEVIKYWDTL